MEGCRVLLQAGADVNGIGELGYTPLHVAVAQNNLPLVRLFLDAGALTNIATEISPAVEDLCRSPV